MGEAGTEGEMGQTPTPLSHLTVKGARVIRRLQTRFYCLQERLQKPVFVQKMHFAFRRVHIHVQVLRREIKREIDEGVGVGGKHVTIYGLHRLFDGGRPAGCGRESKSRTIYIIRAFGRDSCQKMQMKDEGED